MTPSCRRGWLGEPLCLHVSRLELKSVLHRTSGTQPWPTGSHPPTQDRGRGLPLPLHFTEVPRLPSCPSPAFPAEEQSSGRNKRRAMTSPSPCVSDDKSGLCQGRHKGLGHKEP